MKEPEVWSEAEKRFRLRTALLAAARDGLAIEAREQAAKEAASAVSAVSGPDTARRQKETATSPSTSTATVS